MKKLLVIASLAIGLITFIAPSVTKAQIVDVFKPVAAKDTLTNTDTTTITITVDNITRSLELYALKRSGNVGTSKIYLQGSVDGTNFDTIDSLICTNQATNYKVVMARVAPGDFKYRTYQAYCLSAGTVTWEPRVYRHRRSN